MLRLLWRRRLEEEDDFAILSFLNTTMSIQVSGKGWTLDVEDRRSRSREPYYGQLAGVRRFPHHIRNGCSTS